MSPTPEIRYTRSGDVALAYQVTGDGPLDLVFVPGWISNIELAWELPEFARFLGRLAGDQAAEIGLQLRLGLHTGEVRSQGQQVTGMAVHVAARVAALAEPSQILVTGTVKDLVLGSGIGFAEHRTTTLKGVPGTWQLYAFTHA